MEEWATRQLKAHTAFVASEADKARKMRGRGKRKGADTQGEGGVEESDGATGVFESVDLAESLFKGLPVGIKEFMKTEKRLRERKEARGLT